MADNSPHLRIDLNVTRSDGAAIDGDSAVQLVLSSIVTWLCDSATARVKLAAWAADRGMPESLLRAVTSERFLAEIGTGLMVPGTDSQRLAMDEAIRAAADSLSAVTGVMAEEFIRRGREIFGIDQPAEPAKPLNISDIPDEITDEKLQEWMRNGGK